MSNKNLKSNVVLDSRNLLVGRIEEPARIHIFDRSLDANNLITIDPISALELSQILRKSFSQMLFLQRILGKRSFERGQINENLNTTYGLLMLRNTRRGQLAMGMEGSRGQLKMVIIRQVTRILWLSEALKILSTGCAPTQKYDSASRTDDQGSQPFTFRA